MLLTTDITFSEFYMYLLYTYVSGVGDHGRFMRASYVIVD